jgi:hypothetical protein
MLSYVYHSKLRTHNVVQASINALLREDDRLLMGTNWSLPHDAVKPQIQRSIAIEKELKFQQAALLKIKFALINLAYKECTWVK